MKRTSLVRVSLDADEQARLRDLAAYFEATPAGAVRRMIDVMASEVRCVVPRMTHRERLLREAERRTPPHRYDAPWVYAPWDAPWVHALEDRELRSAVIQALLERRVVQESATRRERTLIAAGDRAIHRIEIGGLRGPKARRAAAGALRSYEQAWVAGPHRSASKRGAKARKLSRQAPKG